LNVSLERLDVDGLGPLVAGLGIKGHLGALSERLETFSADGAVVDEEVVSAVVRGDEAEALVVAEPPGPTVPGSRRRKPVRRPGRRGLAA
jgi:hypothetical protein